MVSEFSSTQYHLLHTVRWFHYKKKSASRKMVVLIASNLWIFLCRNFKKSWSLPASNYTMHRWILSLQFFTFKATLISISFNRAVVSVCICTIFFIISALCFAKTTFGAQKITSPILLLPRKCPILNCYNNIVQFFRRKKSLKIVVNVETLGYSAPQQKRKAWRTVKCLLNRDSVGSSNWP